MNEHQEARAIARRRAQTRARWDEEEHPAFTELVERWTMGQRETYQLAAPLIIAVDVEGVSHGNIARALGLSRQAVSVRVARARRYSA